MEEEAERILTRCGQYELLNKFYQVGDNLLFSWHLISIYIEYAILRKHLSWPGFLLQDSDQWQKALEIAEKHDRLHLRSTFYNYARHLESRFDVRGAITYYERSGTSRFEVPRLLFEDWNALEGYVERSEDKSLKRWLAQYLESTGEMEAALHYYQVSVRCT